MMVKRETRVGIAAVQFVLGKKAFQRRHAIYQLATRSERELLI